MSNESRGMLAEAQRLSGDILEQARRSEWEQVGELERMRRDLLQACFPLEISADGLRQAEEQIKNIIELDKSVMALARSRHDELGELLGRLNQGRKAKRAYQNHSSHS